MSITEPDAAERDVGRTGNTADLDARQLAVVAAEVVAMIEHHRDELRAAMAELTALQRTVRSEIRDAVQQLDRIAAGRPGSADPTPDPDRDRSDPSARRGRRH